MYYIIYYYYDGGIVWVASSQWVVMDHKWITIDEWVFWSAQQPFTLIQLIERDPEGRLGYTDDMERAASASKIKQHSFFSSMEMTSEEESQLIREEANYQRSTTDTRSRRRGLSNESFSHMTGSIKRRLSSTGMCLQIFKCLN